MTATLRADAIDGASAGVEELYRMRTPRSRALYERAVRVLPGGSTRAATFYTPYPIHMERGADCRLYDVDGNEYIDCLSNYTSLIHGHAHPRIVAAVTEQAARGTAHGAPVEAEIRLAEMLTSRVPSVDQVRFTNSGTEAVMCAIRAARAYTGRSKVLKMEGGYHGTYDAAEVSVDPRSQAPEWPAGRPDGAGLSPGLSGEVLVAPFNNLAVAAAIIDRHREQLAAVIVEPMMLASGGVPATDAFIRGLRAVTQDAGVLLILDEVVTLRLSYGGGQEHYGVRPDLTTFGKTIGGGLPVGAFGGRAEIMTQFDMRGPDPVLLSGTFNGNAVTMAAGCAALELLTAAEIARINELGDRLRTGLERVANDAGVPVRATGMGSLCHVHLTRDPVSDYRDVARARQSEVGALLHLALLNHGVFAAARGTYSVSTAMTDSEVDAVIAGFGAAVKSIAVE